MILHIYFRLMAILLDVRSTLTIPPCSSATKIRVYSFDFRYYLLCKPTLMDLLPVCGLNTIINFTTSESDLDTLYRSVNTENNEAGDGVSAQCHKRIIRQLMSRNIA